MLRALISWWISDSRYDSLVLEETMKDAFGNNRRLFDVATQGPSACKVGVTVSTIDTAETILATNYRVVETGLDTGRRNNPEFCCPILSHGFRVQDYGPGRCSQ
jgi:hypothetical protein